MVPTSSALLQHSSKQPKVMLPLSCRTRFQAQSADSGQRKQLPRRCRQPVFTKGPLLHLSPRWLQMCWVAKQGVPVKHVFACLPT